MDQTCIQQFSDFCDRFFADCDQIITSYPQTSHFQLCVSLIYTPIQHQLAFKAKLIQQTLLNLNKQLEANANILALPDAYGLFTESSIYADVQSSVLPFGELYSYLDPIQKQNCVDLLFKLVEKFNEVVKYIRATAQADQEVWRMLQQCQAQQDLVSLDSAVQQLDVVL